MSADDVKVAAAGDGLRVVDRAVMLTGGIFVALAMVALTPVLPQIEAALARTADDRLLVKLLVMVIGGTMVLGAPLAGFLVDRVGPRRVLILAGLCYGIGGTAGLYLSSLPLLIVSRLLVGVAAGAIAATSMTLVNASFDPDGRARWMGLHVAVATGGSIILHPVAGLLGEAGWRFPFALYGLGFVLVALSASASETPRRARRSRPADPASPIPRSSWFRLRFLLLALVIGSITYMPVVYVPFVLRQAGVASPLLISLVGLADAILTVVMAALFARSQRLFSPRGAFMFSFACTGTGLMIVSLLPTVPGVICGMMIFGLGLGWFVPNLMTAAGKGVAADHQGRTVGLVKAAHYLAAPLCVLLIEPVTRLRGPVAALGAAALLSLAMLVVLAIRGDEPIWRASGKAVE